jgi:hypothetical protein
MIQYLVMMKMTIPSPTMFNQTLKITIRKVKVTITIVTITTTITEIMVIMNKRTLNNSFQMNKEWENQKMNLMMKI